MRPGISGRYTKAWRARNPELDAFRRLSDRCRQYGLTAEEYLGMLARQGGHCAMCQVTPEEQGRMLAVDHDHSCSCGECVRGLLCSNCNTSLGIIENSELVAAALAYLANPIGRADANG